jgi:hemolysin activation/secretion protein
MIQTNRTTLKLCLLFIALSFVGNAVMFPSLLQAQVSVPPAGESGVGQKALEQSRPEFQPPKEELPPLSIKDSRTVVDPGAGPKFIVKKIEVTGNTLIDDATLAPILEVGDGLEVTLGILHLIAQEITSLYSTKGYILARTYVPEQEIENGTVTLQVVEGKLGKIEVTGNEKFKQEEILARLKPLLNNPALKESTLEKYLLGLNAIQGLKVKAILKPGEVFGTSDLTLQVEESRTYQVAFDADNFGSRFTGEQRYGLTGETGSLFSMGDRLSVRGVTSNDDQVFINPSYSIPIGPYGTTLNLSYTFTDFNLGGNQSLVALNAGGNANIFTAELSHTLVRTRSAEFYLSLGGEIRNFENRELGAASGDDKLRDAYFEAGGFFKDSLRGHTFYSLRLQQGFSESDVSDPLNSRFQGRGDALLSSFDVTRFQSAFIGKTYFMLKSRGQIASKRVLSPDQFAIGGFGSVRGYPLAEAAGDNGFFVSAELIVPFPFKVSVLKNPRPVQLDQILSFFAFLDHGAVFIKNRQPGENDRDLSGAGLGVRLNVSSLGPNYPAVSFALAYGFPVFGGPDPSDGSSNTLYLNGMVSF